MDVSKIRESWGIAPRPGVAWFCVDESQVTFALHKAPGPRRVILRTWPPGTPLACVFARTTTGSSGILQDPHYTPDACDHLTDNPKCDIDEQGRIVINLPLSAKKSVLDHTTATCEEPDPNVTRRVLMAPATNAAPVPVVP
ncbi:hypothetical protein [Nocardioides sp. GCM10030258]|uniref:hypothetical protein n=1 Tax=unclassified Nocardioides TaxID=2615069 RepID=UPI0036101C3E